MEDYVAPSLIGDSEQATRKAEVKAADQWEAEHAKKDIVVAITVDGTELHRNFRAHEVSDIDWNPVINDMADTIDKSNDGI